jgi:hypothetical protein
MTRSSRIAGWIMSGLAIAFLLMDSIMKFAKPSPVIETTASLGYSEEHIVPMGVLCLAGTMLYMYRRTSIFGALMLTGYFGGAIASQLRIGSPLFSHTLFPVYMAVLVWGGLWLRDTRARQLLSFNSKI